MEQLARAPVPPDVHAPHLSCRNFCKPDVQAVKSFVRHIMSFDIEPVEASCSLDSNSSSNIDSCQGVGSNGRSQVYVMTIKGTAFLWHQVRLSVCTCVCVM